MLGNQDYDFKIVLPTNTSIYLELCNEPKPLQTLWLMTTTFTLELLEVQSLYHCLHADVITGAYMHWSLTWFSPGHHRPTVSCFSTVCASGCTSLERGFSWEKWGWPCSLERLLAMVLDFYWAWELPGREQEVREGVFGGEGWGCYRGRSLGSTPWGREWPLHLQRPLSGHLSLRCWCPRIKLQVGYPLSSYISQLFLSLLMWPSHSREAYNLTLTPLNLFINT